MPSALAAVAVVGAAVLVLAGWGLTQAGFRIDARHCMVVKAARPAERWLVARRPE